MSAVGDWVQGFFKLLLQYFTPIGAPRGDIRHDIKAAITVKSDGFAVDCMTINISPSGILVDRALEAAKPGMRVQVTAFGGSSGISGRVIRVGANSTAIRIDGHRGSAFLGALRVHANRPSPAFGGASRPMAKRPRPSHTTLLP